MGIPTMTLAAVRPAVVGAALALCLVIGASAGDGYFMQGKVTRVNSDGTIDFWVTAVHGLPREESAESRSDLAELPRVIATLELKSTGTAPGVRDADLRGSRISLRGKCEKVDRATRSPVLQVRLGTSRQWRQASLKPGNRAGTAGFQQIAAAVCASAADSEPASTESTDGAG